jgi:tetratricopeptide (TPR) repeat protein
MERRSGTSGRSARYRDKSKVGPRARLKKLILNKFNNSYFFNLKTTLPFQLLFLFFTLAFLSCEENVEPKAKSLVERTDFAGVKTREDSLLTLIRVTDDDTMKARYLNELSSRWMNTKVDTGITMSEEALALSQRHNFLRGLSDAHHNLGTFCFLKGNYSGALEHLFLALEAREKRGIVTDITTTLGTIAVVYQNQGERAKAMEYFQKALKLSEEIGNKKGIARHRGNMGNIYLEAKQYSKALEYYSTAAALNRELKNMNGLSINLGNLGSTYAEMSERAETPAEKTFYLQKALEYYRSSRAMSDSLGLLRGVMIQDHRIGHTYKLLGIYDTAETLMLRTERYFDSVGALDELKENELHLANLYDTVGRYKEEVGHLHKLIRLNDTLFNMKSTKESMRSELNFEFEKQKAVDKEKARQEIERQKFQRNALIAGLALLLVVALLSFRGYRNKNGFEQREPRLLAVEDG